MEDYSPPSWAASLDKVAPRHRYRLRPLGCAATPIEPFVLHHDDGASEGRDTCSALLKRLVEHGIKLSIKRDDYTGLLVSGNKIRKLEFIMAHVIENVCHCQYRSAQSITCTRWIVVEIGVY
jgi:hypothetical protein